MTNYTAQWRPQMCHLLSSRLLFWFLSERVAMMVSDNPTDSTYKKINVLLTFLLVFPQNVRRADCSPAAFVSEGLPVCWHALSLTPRMLRDTNVIWWSRHWARCVLPRRPSFRWRSTEYKPWLFGETDVGPDCRSLKPYWVSAKRLTPSISHHRSSQLSLPSGLISSPGRDQHSSIHCTLKRARESLLKINK